MPDPLRLDPKARHWFCRIGPAMAHRIPGGADAPLRRATQDAFYAMFGEEAEVTASGWTDGHPAYADDAALPVPTSEEPPKDGGRFVRVADEIVATLRAHPSEPVTVQIEDGADGELQLVAKRHDCHAPVPPIREDVERAVDEYGQQCRYDDWRNGEPDSDTRNARAHLLSLFPSGGTVGWGVQGRTGHVSCVTQLRADADRDAVECDKNWPEDAPHVVVTLHAALPSLSGGPKDA